MNYTKLLNQLIDASGLQLKEIAEKCVSLGENVSASYISVLKNTEGRTASDNISRAIAVACGAAHEDILVTQAYLDDAPSQILTLLSSMKDTALASSLFVIKNSFGEDAYRTFEHELSLMSLAQFVCEANQYSFPVDFTNHSTMPNVNISFDGINSITVSDDSMEPILAEGSRVTLESDVVLKSGDLVYYKNAKTDEKRIRLYIETELGVWAFVPFCKNYPPETLSKDQFIILGRVKDVTRKL